MFMATSKASEIAGVLSIKIWRYFASAAATTISRIH